ncbi:MAG: hypothetical protein UZ01_03083 [Candidatus Brocadia sinica]|uniref:Uncharacterized protein n=2 Tax=Candidatus Brocadia TaxID=380240 RepID=A0ABQ0JZP1_9BACT|nr:MAG: hypothetical protein UZ01_03083 [Candidatus Brocadia sinica]GAN34237.1 hypothetical protein BROSI_A2773 [Candidatus Brocadia sinica JPN1]GJQ19535.1 MAG: hypothetical protein HBSIN01_34940 [Candidatus Brocadia sinica]
MLQADLKQQRNRIVNASRTGWATMNKEIEAASKNDLVDVIWDVYYDELGHDIIIQAKVKVRSEGDVLLQVWLNDQLPKPWIPEFRPWVSSVSEFTPMQQVKEVLVGLIDSKWRSEDVGETYTAAIWGYILHSGVIESFAFNKEFKYPG